MELIVIFLPILWYNHIDIHIIFMHTIPFLDLSVTLFKFILIKYEKLGIIYAYIIPIHT